jgi:pantoate--beta-alanine ligase
MLTLTTVAGVHSRRLELYRRGVRLALVPTMGALHEGHLALVRRAAMCADEVWASVFVNPTQFVAGEDFERYPRDLERDQTLLAELGVAVLFAPATKEIYPRPGVTTVDLSSLAAAMCGAHRPGHFRGVAMVVAKLFNIVQPDVAIFGAKDWQQATVIKRMAADLSYPIAIEVVPTVREEDGLAMSSRNAYLTPAERKAAPALYASLCAAESAFRAGERDGQRLHALLAEGIRREPLAQLQYAAVVDPETLEPPPTVGSRVLLALAVTIGTTRLIDNLLVEVS